MKKVWKPGTLLAPVPPVMVSCGDMDNSNIITIAWTGIINSNPPKTYISVRPQRHSFEMIKNTKEFVINLTTEQMARATDWCGVKSGRDVNKWEAMGLTPMANEHVAAPLVAESPLSICCKVRQVIELGSHDMFLADVVGIEADKRFIDPETGKFSLDKAHPIVYSHGEYFRLGELIGHFGWSVRKRATTKKR